MVPQRRGDVVPKATNGKVDWLAYVRTTWPIVIFVGGLIFYFGGRMQTPAEKQAQNELWNRAWRTKADRNEGKLDALEAELRSHERMNGHKVMEDRYERLIMRIETLEKESHQGMNK